MNTANLSNNALEKVKKVSKKVQSEIPSSSSKDRLDDIVTIIIERIIEEKTKNIAV